MEAYKLDLIIISKRENDAFRHNYVGFPMSEVRRVAFASKNGLLLTRDEDGRRTDRCGCSAVRRTSCQRPFDPIDPIDPTTV